MTFNALAAHNYKCFNEDGFQASLRPLTLLIGPNSAGKSALARLPILLADSLAHPSPGILRMQTRDLWFGGGLASVVHQEQPDVPMTFQLGFHKDETAWVWGMSIMQVAARSGDHPQVLHWVLKTKDESQSLEVRHPIGQAPQALLNGQAIPPPLPLQEAMPPRSWILDRLINAPSATVLRMVDELSHLHQRIRHIGPFRALPQRTYDLRALNENPSSAGAEAILALALSHQGDGLLFAQVSKWFEDHLGVGLSLDTPIYSKASEVVSLLVRDEKGYQVNLADTGVGIAQVLPIVVARFLSDFIEDALPASKQTQLLVVEQPELHLHPSAHADLGTLFVGLANSHRTRAIVETHSEALLLRIRRHVAQGAIAPERIALHWLESEDGSTQVRPLNIEPDGWVPDWPHGVFSEDVEEAEALARAMRKYREAAS